MIIAQKYKPMKGGLVVDEISLFVVEESRIDSGGYWGQFSCMKIEKINSMSSILLID